MNFKTIEWKKGKVIMLDQRALPQEKLYVEYSDYKQVADAIELMVIRGAPAIGVAGAMGAALGACGIRVSTFDEFIAKFDDVCTTLEAARPTASNLSWAVRRMRQVAGRHKKSPLPEIQKHLEAEALAIADEDAKMCRAIGRHGSELIRSGAKILTHCNAGALATAGIGTALAPIYTAQEQGKKLSVYCTETRPWLQGARLTAWELLQNDVAVTLITDGSAASLLASNEIDLVIVGADRIAANGDVANKIGTLSLAIAAQRYRIPFYVAAPSTTLDHACLAGTEIPIEQRRREEITHFGRIKIAPDEVRVLNPVFDVTPHDLITGIITERGVHRAPYKENLHG